MGWSCSADAGATADAWTAACIKSTGSQNVWEEGTTRFFYEISDTEHADGAITGKVWKFVSLDACRPVSAFRIEPDGRVSRGCKWLKDAAQGARRRFGDLALPGSGGLRA